MTKELRVSLSLGIIPEGTIWQAGFDKIKYSGGMWEGRPSMNGYGYDWENTTEQDIITRHFLYHIQLPWYKRVIRRLWWRTYAVNGTTSHFILIDREWKGTYDNLD